MALGDEIVVMREGAIEQRGTPQDVYARPATEFVGTFIGSPTMNVVAGRVEDGRFVSEELTVEAPVGDRTGEVRLGVRPDDVRLAGTIPAERASPPFRATVEVIEVLGSRGILTLRTGRGRPLRAVVEPIVLAGLKEGQEAEFVLDRHALHLFPA